MKHKPLLSVLVLTAAASLANLPASAARNEPAPVGDSARVSLDWPGAYEGVLPCASCPGIRTRLTLSVKGGYELSTQYLEKQKKPSLVKGKFAWEGKQSSIIRLDKQGKGQRYFVAEGRLIQLREDGSLPTDEQASRYTLFSVK